MMYLIEFLKSFRRERCPTRSENYTHEMQSVNTRFEKIFQAIGGLARHTPEA
jgi:hypothetical protein